MVYNHKNLNNKWTCNIGPVSFFDDISNDKTYSVNIINNVWSGQAKYIIISFQ